MIICKCLVLLDNRSGATRDVSLDTYKASIRVWHAGLLFRIKSYRISIWVFGLILSFLSNRWILFDLDGKSLQECVVSVGDPQGSILGSAFFLLFINDLLMKLSVIVLSILMILHSTLSVISHLIYGSSLIWLLNLNLTYETL